MDCVRNDVAEVEKIKGSLVRDDRLLLPHRKPGGNNVTVRGRWVIAQPVQSTTNTAETPGGSVVAQRLALEAGSRCVPGCEVPVLLRGDAEESNMV